MKDEDVYLEDLSDGQHELMEVVGLPALIKLAEAFGGIRVHVPAQYDDEHPIVRIAGRETLVKLVRHYGGSRLYVGKLAPALRAIRNIEISRRYEGGIPVSRLVHEYGLCERQIWNILKKPETLRGAPQQNSLFD